MADGVGESVEDRLRSFLTIDLQAGSPQELDDAYPLLEREVIDSVGIFQIVGFVEDEFDIEILDDDLRRENFATIADIATLVRARVAG